MKRRSFHQKNSGYLILNSKKAISGGGLLGIVFGVAAFWILVKYLLIGGVIGTTALFTSPMLWIAIILFIIFWRKQKG